MRLLKVYWAHVAIVISVLFGQIWRVKLYANANPLIGGEVMLTLNLLQRSYLQLLEPLHYAQGAPILFLWIQKAIMDLVGTSDDILRLFPLLSGLLALFIFPFISYRFLSIRGVLWATLLIASSLSIIYYTSQAKQYNVDVLVTMLALLLFLVILEKTLTILDVIWVGTAGGALILLSHPAIFILGPAGLIALWGRWHQGKNQQVWHLIVIGSIWLAIFSANFFITVGDLAQDAVLLQFWEYTFPPTLNKPLMLLEWIEVRFFALFTTDIFNLSFAGMGGMFLILGVFSLAKRDLLKMLSLTLPFFVTFVAAYLHFYPFANRLILFLAPLLAILVAEGIEQLLRWPRSLVLKVAVTAVVIMFFIHPLKRAMTLKSDFDGYAAVRDIYEYANDNWEDGDVLLEVLGDGSDDMWFMIWARQPSSEEKLYEAFSYEDEWSLATQELDRISTQYERIWFVYPTLATNGDPQKEARMLSYLEEIGGQLESKTYAPGAVNYLYDFTPELNSKQ